MFKFEIKKFTRANDYGLGKMKVVLVKEGLATPL